MLLIEASGYRTMVAELALDRRSSDEELRWALEPAADVRGTMIDDRGEPVGGAAISIRPTNLLASLRGRIPPESN